MNLFHNVRAQWLAYAVFFIALALVPLFVGDDVFLLNQLSMYGVYAMLALGISLCWGFGGILNLGQGIPFGLGAYGMAMTMQMQTQDEYNPMPPFMLNNSLTELPWFWVPFGNTTIGIILTIAIPALFCAVFGWTMFRARVSGPFFAIMTLAMLSAIGTLFLGMQPYTNGANGLSPPRALQLGEVTVDPYSAGSYWTVFALLLVATVIAKLMTLSRSGLVARSIRNDAERVRFLGYNVAAYETMIYTVSGIFAAVAGALMVVLSQYVSPAKFDPTFSLMMVVWAGIGGRMSLLAAMLGAFLIQGGQSYLGDRFEATWYLFLGAFFIVVVRFLPKGLIGLVESGLGRIRFGSRRSDGDGAVAETSLKPQPGA